MNSGLSYARRVLNQEDRPLNAKILTLLNSQTYKELPNPREKKVHNKKKKSLRGDLYHKQHSECFYCWQVTPMKRFTLDHVIPRSNGGLLSRANTVGACIECNEAKRDMSREEFEASAYLLNKRFPV